MRYSTLTILLLSYGLSLSAAQAEKTFIVNALSVREGDIVVDRTTTDTSAQDGQEPGYFRTRREIVTPNGDNPNADLWKIICRPVAKHPLKDEFARYVLGAVFSEVVPGADAGGLVVPLLDYSISDTGGGDTCTGEPTDLAGRTLTPMIPVSSVDQNGAFRLLIFYGSEQKEQITRLAVQAATVGAFFTSGGNQVIAGVTSAASGQAAKELSAIYSAYSKVQVGKESGRINTPELIRLDPVALTGGQRIRSITIPVVIGRGDEDLLKLGKLQIAGLVLNDPVDAARAFSNREVLKSPTKFAVRIRFQYQRSLLVDPWRSSPTVEQVIDKASDIGLIGLLSSKEGSSDSLTSIVSDLTKQMSKCTDLWNKIKALKAITFEDKAILYQSLMELANPNWHKEDAAKNNPKCFNDAADKISAIWPSFTVPKTIPVTTEFPAAITSPFEKHWDTLRKLIASKNNESVAIDVSALFAQTGDAIGIAGGIIPSVGADRVFAAADRSEGIKLIAGWKPLAMGCFIADEADPADKVLTVAIYKNGVSEVKAAQMAIDLKTVGGKSLISSVDIVPISAATRARILSSQFREGSHCAAQILPVLRP